MIPILPVAGVMLKQGLPVARYVAVLLVIIIYGRQLTLREINIYA